MDELHEKVFLFMEEYRLENPGFTYWLRQRDRKPKNSDKSRFEKGFWFQGKSDYAFVGLYNASGGSNMTRSFGLVFFKEKDEIKWHLEVVFNEEKDSRLIRFYQEAVELLEGKLIKHNETKYTIHYKPASFESAKEFLNSEKPKIDALLKDSDLDSLFISSDLFKRIFENVQSKRKDLLVKSTTDNLKSQNAKILNQILFGPPGTGKTYATIEKAIQIVNPEFNLKQDRKKVKAEYDKLQKKGRIVFTTFHQSMSYEDFIEGIKPNLENDDKDDNESISYKIEDGLFKKICVEAGYEFVEQQSSQTLAQKVVSYEQAYLEFLNEVEEQLEKEGKMKIPLKAGNDILITEITAQNNFKLQHIDGEREYTVSKNRAEKLFNEIDDFDNIPNIYAYFREIIGGSNASAYWAVLNQIYPRIKTKTSDIRPIEVGYESKLNAVQRLNWSRVEPEIKVPNYVLIIDEINRGNVSSIFGELITLIEDDKRAGSNEALKVKLPYSKKDFSVPSNLYIIGTMNTADRSVEALDSALRRRFAFEEVSPNPSLLSPKSMIVNVWNIESYAELGWSESPFLEHANSVYKFLGIEKSKAESKAIVIEPKLHTNWLVSTLDYLTDEDFNGINLELLLDAINNRIRVLLDKDHQIGHAYLINIYKSTNPVEELKLVFQNKIIPLLQEYFYGNYGKIERIIGASFFENAESDSIIFANGSYDIEDYVGRKVYEFKNLETMNSDEFIEVVKKIY